MSVFSSFVTFFLGSFFVMQFVLLSYLIRIFQILKKNI